MIRNFLIIAILLAQICCFANGINTDKRRSDEVRVLMWSSGDKDFTSNAIPDKWKDESAVIIAKSISLSYRKSALSSNLNYDRYVHYRIKLLNTKAVEEYAQFKLGGSIDRFGLQMNVYAGFKVVKGNGTSVDIPFSQAVQETETINSRKRDVYKLAIPNLEVGDIIDYYLVYETDINIGSSKYYSFDPFIVQLHANYPIVKQKISFDVLRRCYINLKTLNGAPEFKLSEDENDRNRYYLEDGDRESVRSMPWLYENRQLPGIKFKVIYASAMAASVIPVFMGQPGKIKSKVEADEVSKFIGYMYRYQNDNALKKYMAKNFKSEKDRNVLAREAYYALRYVDRTKNAELNLLSGRNPNPESETISLIDLSKYYKSKNIPHVIMVGVSRESGSLDDLILEEELTLMLKVNTAKSFYVGRLDNNSMIDEIDTDLQGQEVYYANGILPSEQWSMAKDKIPVVGAEKNRTESTYKIKFTDLDEGAVEIEGSRAVSGASRVEYQNQLMTFYDYADEEKKRHPMADEEKLTPSLKEQVKKLRNEYKSTEKAESKKSLKEMLEREFDFTIEDASDLVIKQTGRFEDKPEFIFGFKAQAKGLVKRAGPNYLFDAGKFIEKQATLSLEQKNRKFDVYLPAARSFICIIEITIPEGYTVKGLDQLSVKVKNDYGRFITTAVVKGNTLTITTDKAYETNFVGKENWKLLMAFVDAASDFTKKQILFEKK